MKAWFAAASHWWRALGPRRRLVLALAVAVVAPLLAGVAWYQIGIERVRWRSNAEQAAAQWQRMQEAVAETRRLRSLPPPAPLAGQALVNALAVSLQREGLKLKLTPLNAEQVQVQGVASFDEAILWLGMVQRDYQLRVVSLVTSRIDGAVTLDASLGISRQ